MSVEDAVVIMRPDFIALAKEMTDHSKQWYVYMFKNETYGVMLNYMCHRFKGRFEHSTIVNAFTRIGDEIAQMDMNVVKML